jgi:hypothetical protein
MRRGTVATRAEGGGEFGRTEDGDLASPTEAQQVTVVADDDGCPSSLGGLEHTIVVGVVHDDADAVDRFDDLADANELSEGSPHELVLPPELLGEDPTQLSQQRR